jgi:hypothetical protein
MEIQSVIETAYAIGGAWAVATLVLAWAVVYLYRAREREHRERLKEARESATLLAKLLQQASRASRRPPPSPDQLPWYDESDDEEPTLVTRMRQEHVQALVRKYLEDSGG